MYWEFFLFWCNFFTGHILEGEGNDRPDINIPGHQLDLLKDVTTISGNNGNIKLILEPFLIIATFNLLIDFVTVL